MGRYMPEGWPLPGVDGPNRPFFTSGKLLLQKCSTCGTIQHPPEEVCYHCQGTAFDYVESAGRGQVYSYIVVHHPVSPLMRELVPYGVALIQLDDYPQVRLLGNVLNVEPSELRIGLPVRVTFEEIPGEETADAAAGGRLLMPQWLAV